MDEMKKEHQKLHIAVFPWLAFGHFLPFLRLSNHLAQLGHRISFISTPKNLHRLSQIAPNLSSLVTMVPLPLPPVHGLPDSVESTSELLFRLVPYLKRAYDQLQPPLTEFLQNSDVNWLIHDFVPHWLPQVATRLGINSVFFSIFNASVLAFLGSPEELLRRDQQPLEDLTVEVIHHQECMDSDASDFFRFAKVIEGCRFVAIRSCPEFESDSLSLLQKLYRKPTRDDPIITGFEARVSGRGLVWVGWDPQKRIMAHPSIGGFLTHCGWSSVTEALGSGRVLILFPGACSDQGLMARLLVGKQVGLEIPRNEQDGSFTSDSVSESIRRVMVEEEGEQLKRNAWAMKEIFGNVQLQNKYLDEFTRVLESELVLTKST
ncbi:hypothetical protein AAG906_009678 [Vitis piasezkii]